MSRPAAVRACTRVLGPHGFDEFGLPEQGFRRVRVVGNECARADAQCDPTPSEPGNRRVDVQTQPPAFNCERSLGPVHALELGRHEIHLRRADEARHEHVRRPGEDIMRRGHLLDYAVAHDGDAVGHGEGLELIVGDDDGRLGETRQHALDLAAHGLPEFDVEARQRFVEQEAVGVSNDGARHRHPLLLPFRYAAWQSVEHPLQLQKVGDPADARRRGRGVEPLAVQGEHDVLAHRQCGVERVELEHHGDIALLRPQPIHAPASNDHLARARTFEAGDDAQRGRLAAA